ncbi:ankyrin repeat-containing domain protein, partial [Spinellus fusiger]
HYAASKNRIEATRLLLKHNASLNATNHIQQTPLHCAAAQGNTALVRVLIEAKAHLNVRDSAANTPLHLACEEGRGDTALLLIQHGARADQPNHGGMTALAVCDPSLEAYLKQAIEKQES